MGKKPFSESIIDAINKCDEQTAPFLANLIKHTIFAENHDAIIKAWKERMQKLSYHDFGVRNSLLADKQHATSFDKNSFLRKMTFIKG